LLSIGLLVQVILINTLLSGDNALAIAMAARHLPGPRRRAAMLWGGILAVVLQIVFTLVIAHLMRIPGLRFVGAILLLGIAFRLVQDEVQTAREGTPPPTSLRTAVFRIAVANLVMSLDNILAIAAVSGSDPVLMAVGLVLSITAILTFSRVILAFMNRFPWIIYAGTSVLALTAAGMMVHELEAIRQIARTTGPLLHVPLWADWGFRGAVAGLCTTSGLWWPATVSGRQARGTSKPTACEPAEPADPSAGSPIGLTLQTEGA
jgi:YjbE family integral membrane protein